MGWTHGGRYYTRSRRVNGHTEREYVGGGLLGELAALADAFEGEGRRQARLAREGEIAKLGQLADEVKAVAEQGALLARAALLAAGCHQHKRGEWRRRRTMSSASATTTASAPVPAGAGQMPDFRELLRRADAGDETARADMRKYLRLDDKLPDLLGGNLAYRCNRKLTNLVARDNVCIQEALERKVELMSAELLGAAPTALEKLLVDRIITCWLGVHWLELLAANDKLNPAVGAYVQRALSQAHRRYLGSIRTLAAVRKLALPALQLNVANQQVNVAGRG